MCDAPRCAVTSPTGPKAFAKMPRTPMSRFSAIGFGTNCCRSSNHVFRQGSQMCSAREAFLAQQDEDFLRREAIEKAREIVLTSDGDFEERLQIDIPALRSVHPALASRVAHDVLSRLAGTRPISFDHVRRLLDLAAEGRDGAFLSLPGQHAERRGRSIVLRSGRGGARRRGELFHLFVVYSRRGGIGTSRLGHSSRSGGVECGRARAV